MKTTKQGVIKFMAEHSTATTIMVSMVNYPEEVDFTNYGDGFQYGVYSFEELFESVDDSTEFDVYVLVDNREEFTSQILKTVRTQFPKAEINENGNIIFNADWSIKQGKEMLSQVNDSVVCTWLSAKLFDEGFRVA